MAQGDTMDESTGEYYDKSVRTDRYFLLPSPDVLTKLFARSNCENAHLTGSNLPIIYTYLELFKLTCQSFVGTAVPSRLPSAWEVVLHSPFYLWPF